MVKVKIKIVCTTTTQILSKTWRSVWSMCSAMTFWCMWRCLWLIDFHILTSTTTNSILIFWVLHMCCQNGKWCWRWWCINRINYHLPHGSGSCITVILHRLLALQTVKWSRLWFTKCLGKRWKLVEHICIMQSMKVYEIYFSCVYHLFSFTVIKTSVCGKQTVNKRIVRTYLSRYIIWTINRINRWNLFRTTRRSRLNMVRTVVNFICIMFWRFPRFRNVLGGITIITTTSLCSQLFCRWSKEILNVLRCSISGNQSNGCSTISRPKLAVWYIIVVGALRLVGM